MKYATVSCFVCLGAILWAMRVADAEERDTSPAYGKKGWSTIALGGVQVSPKQLRAMQEGDPEFQVPAGQRQLFLDDVGIAKIVLYSIQFRP